MSHPESKTWQINLFGTLEVTAPSGELFHIASRKGAELLAFLALRRTPLVDRDTVAEALWPETDLFTARNRLKATLSIIKREVAGLPILTHGKRFLELCRDRVLIDYERCESRLKWRRSLTGRNRAAFAKQFLEDTRGGLLPDLGAPWILADRDRYAALNRELEHDLAEGGPSVVAGFRVGDELGGVEVPLVGRVAELRRVEAWLSDPASRVLHLVGMPGVGKTRLLKAALQKSGEVCDATITLSTVQTSEVPWLDRLGQVLGIQKSGDVARGLAQLLADYRHPLLVLDDLDQASAEMKAWVDEIMRAIPHLKLLGAARRRPSDPRIDICDLSTFAKGNLETDSATDLLVSFARHFGASEEDLNEGREALSEIAEHLEGLPLALEVAAAWLPIIQPASLSLRLGSSPELITRRPGAGRDSLVDCVSAICNDLSPEDLDALMCLSACRGGCGEALAEQMLGSEWLWRISMLVDRSLALRVEGQVGNRYLVLQAIREAVREITDPDRMAKAESSWRAACFVLGEQAYFEVNERDHRRWLRWLRDEGDNIVAACTGAALSRPDMYRAVDVLYGLVASFRLIGRAHEVRRAIDELRARALDAFWAEDASTPTPVIQFRVKALTQAGRLTEAIRTAASHRLSLERGSDLPRLAHALDFEGDARDLEGDYEGSVACWTRCSELFERAGYRRHAVWIECKIAGTEILAGRFADAQARKERMLERARQVGDDNSIGMYLKEFAAYALENREFDEAIRLAEEAVEAFRRSGEITTLCHALVVLAATYLASNDVEAARRVLTEAQTLDPNLDAEYEERLATLLGYVASQARGRLFYDHLTVEH